MHRIRNLTESAICIALIAALAQLVLPLPGGVPATLQTLGVAFCGYYLEAERGSGAVAVYLLLGALGLPVFSAFTGGLSSLLGPTGGYLWGFLLLALFCGIKGRLSLRLIFGVLGLLLLHGIGALWYGFSAKVPLGGALLSVTMPTFWKDLLSLPLAFFLSQRVRKILKK